jgi:hypothetical protein
VPWSVVAIADPESLEIEPTMAILETVRDHDGFYGMGTLQKMLLGEAFGRSDGTRYQLSAYARNSEHFGTLRGVITRQKLQEHFDRLIAGGQIATIEKDRPDYAGTYQALRLTNRGRDILAGAAPIPGNEEAVEMDTEAIPS